MTDFVSNFQEMSTEEAQQTIKDMLDARALQVIDALSNPTKESE